MRRPPIEDFTDANLEVRPPMTHAVGVEAVEKAMLPAVEELGPVRTGELSLTINHKRGFDCPSCAWANPDHSKMLELCEQGIKNVVWDATPLAIPDAFWETNSLTSLSEKSEWWLGQQGRITRPMHKAADSDHYTPVSWDAALDLVTAHLQALRSPDEAAFYMSGRITNEPAFLVQLLARAFGTNNLPDCNNLCHEASADAMTTALGVGKSTVSYDDFARTELIIVMGQNPGTNHPRMLNALQDAKDAGADMVAVNPLPESSLINYRDPQRPRGVVGRGTPMADQFLQIRAGGDQHLIQAVAKRVFEAEDAAPGTVLDHAFIEAYTSGIDAFRARVMAVDEDDVLEATGLTSAEIDDLAERYIRSNATIITWALGIAQQSNGVATVADIVNLLLLRGNIGKPGAGASPVRGHSNVQGDRTMGICEDLDPALGAALEREYHFTPPTASGLDAVETMNALDEGRLRVLVSFAGNLVAAMSDSNRSDAGVRNADLTVQVATKLNRSHVVTGRESLLLPVLVRVEKDVQASGKQFCTTEDTVCTINMTHGELRPLSDDVRSEVWVVCELGKRLLRHAGIPWQAYEDDYDAIRDAISRCIPGFADFNHRIRTELAFVLPHPPRDSRTFPTPSGRAVFTDNDLYSPQVPDGRLLLQTLRAHDQHNTTIYGLDDRYRGIHKGRFVVLVHPDDLTDLGLADGQTVDIVSEWPGADDLVLRGYRAVGYPTARGCAALYFPEGNALVHRSSVDPLCNTPGSKQVIIRLEPGRTPAATGRPLTR